MVGHLKRVRPILFTIETVSEKLSRHQGITVRSPDKIIYIIYSS